MCRPLEEVHQEQIVHRDLKPSNVMTVAAQAHDFVKVLDFGLETVWRRAASNFTVEGVTPVRPANGA
jgi:serine/threonine protein kinase